MRLPKKESVEKLLNLHFLYEIFCYCLDAQVVYSPIARKHFPCIHKVLPSSSSFSGTFIGPLLKTKYKLSPMYPSFVALSPEHIVSGSVKYAVAMKMFPSQIWASWKLADNSNVEGTCFRSKEQNVYPYMNIFSIIYPDNRSIILTLSAPGVFWMV